MKNMTARDIMSPNPATVRDNDSITQALAVMKSKSISGTPVLDETGQLCGLISLKDIAFDALWRGEHRTDSDSGYLVQSSAPNEPFELPEKLEIPNHLTVADIMTPMVFSISVDATLNEIAENMSKGRVHRLVVTEDDTVVGIVSSMDLLKVIRVSD